MKEHPILFSAPMVRAILEGRKTMTRRIMKEQPKTKVRSGSMGYWSVAPDVKEYECPCGEIGDRLWVREKWAAPHEFDHLKPVEIPQGTRIHYAATAYLGGDNGLGGLRSRPSIFMPRWMSRITLEITDVRAERLQDISKEDSIREGVEETAVRGIQCFVDYLGKGERNLPSESPRLSFRSLWKSIYGADSWNSDPWVWVISFRRIEIAMNPIRGKGV